MLTGGDNTEWVPPGDATVLAAGSPEHASGADRPPMGQDARDEAPRESIRRYKLLQQIGEGGFGTVWMAEQTEPVSRMVALKIIKPGMDTREVIARFEAERQALAMMDHPNIAKVHDAGATDQGRPFFVMELVKGVSITQFCDEQQLGNRERLALFGDVCAAINHAHQKGIIHRDIKPSNVMVTLHSDKPVVKVIDFGIAKATQGKLTDKTLFTRLDQFVGTPVYMSPEQASLNGLDIDTRSDIYALGILLYELLTGKPPFDPKSLLASGYDEMRRIICEEEPPRPSSRLHTAVGKERTTLARARHIAPEKLHRLVEPDLDWIVMKAIEKERTRRYETANGLAQDIRRFFADEPVSATPPSTSYRFRKFVRRNRAVLRVALAVAAVLVAATVVSLWQAVRATTAEDLATRHLADVVSERDAKDKARQAAESALGEAQAAREEAEAVSRFLTGIFQSPDPNREGRTITVAEMLGKAAQEVTTGLASQPSRQAKLRSALASAYTALGLYPDALPLLEESLHYYQSASGAGHPDTLYAMLALAGAYFKENRQEEGFKLQENVLSVRQRISGPEHEETVGVMAALASSCFNHGRRNEAVSLQEKVLAFHRKRFGPDSRRTAGAMHTMATFYSATGRQEEATELEKATIQPLEEALAACRQVNGPEHPDTIRAMIALVSPYYDTGRKDEGLAYLDEALRLCRKTLGPENPFTLEILGDSTYFKNHAGHPEEAVPLQRELVALRKKVNGPEHPDTLGAMEWLATLLDGSGNPSEALQHREELMAIRRKVSGPEHPETQSVMQRVAHGYDAAGRDAEAKQLRDELAALHPPVSVPPPIVAPNNNYTRAVAYMDTGRHGDARPLLTELVAAARTEGAAAVPGLESRLGALAETLFRLGRFAEAEPVFREKLESERRRDDDGAKAVALRTTSSLARLLTESAWAGRTGPQAPAQAREAVELLRICLAKTEAGPDAGTWRMGDLQSRLGGALLVLSAISGNLPPADQRSLLDEAGSLLHTGQNALDAASAQETKYRRDGMLRLVRVAEFLNNPDEAASWKRKLAALDGGEFRRLGPTGAIPSGSPLRVQFPPRPAEASPDLIDLSSHYNAFPDTEWQGRQGKGNHFGELQPGCRNMGGILWDVRGLIQLSAKPLGKLVPPYPEKVEGIRVGQQCRRIHFLHAAAYGQGPEQTIGYYLIHSAGGAVEKLPLRTGSELNDWWEKPKDGAALPVVAWSGQNTYSRVIGGSIHLFKTSWDNPRPEAEILTLDFVSTMTDAAPFLVAVTVEAVRAD